MGPVSGFSLVLSVLGGILLLGEREHLRLKLAGMAVASAGVVMPWLA